MQRVGQRGLLVAAIFCSAFGVAGAAPPVREATACVAPAAKFHRVNAQVLEAILRVESGLNPAAVGKNTNGTTDMGIAQINSAHFAELKRYGIVPNDLMSPCIGTYVGAWHLSKQYVRYGNTWFAIGAYHSVTPEHNLRYQHLVYDQIVRMNAKAK